jgi:hypothetical protein
VFSSRVPGWALVSAAAAPALLVGGWTLAAVRQPPAYDATRDTISALAGHDATDPWLMTSALAGLGVCHVVTAAGLRPAGRTGRALLATGGVATVLVAASPLPPDGTSAAHTAAAALAFGALAVWPLGSPPQRGRSSDEGTDDGSTTDGGVRVPWPLRRPVAATAAALLTGLVGWFGVALVADTARAGLAERVAAGAQALWPLAVVLGVLAVGRSAR